MIGIKTESALVRLLCLIRLGPKTMAPVLSRLTVSGNSLQLQFDRDIDLSIFSDYFDSASRLLDKFSLRIAGRARSLYLVSFSRDQPRQLILHFSGAAAASDQAVLLSYLDPLGDDTNGVVQDLYGVDLGKILARHADAFVSARNVLTLAPRYRDLTLTDAATIGTGNDVDNVINVRQGVISNTLLGLAGNDRIQAGAGADTLIGGAGDDTLDGQTGRDVYLIESSDHHGRAEINDTGMALPMPSSLGDQDELRFAATSLAGGSTLTVFAGDSGLEMVTIGIGLDITTVTLPFNINATEAPNALMLTGNAGDNELIGSRFNDVLIGGAGTDLSDGRDGSDIYVVQDRSHISYREIRDTGFASDRDELRIASPGSPSGPAEAWDLVLPYDHGLERVVIGTGLGVVADTSGLGRINFYDGGSTPLTIIGNNGNNRLSASTSDDWIQGNGGRDSLDGSYGDDILIGGSGADRLEGGGGRDQFLFDSPLTGERDDIPDFILGEDQILLSRAVFDLPPGSTLPETAFKFGRAADSASQRILTFGSGVFYDRDGNGPAVPVPFATVLTFASPTRASMGLTSLIAADFLIVP
ncbi:MAG: calcium-binding protein [Cyanobacteriota bacterium]|nr:calcium-binding protein [Cyanobacteriota bacterium]